MDSGLAIQRPSGKSGGLTVSQNDVEDESLSEIACQDGMDCFQLLLVNEF